MLRIWRREGEKAQPVGTLTERRGIEPSNARQNGLTVCVWRSTASEITVAQPPWVRKSDRAQMAMGVLGTADQFLVLSSLSHNT